MPYARKGNAGFTIVELVIVIAVIVVMAVALVVALNPARRLAAAQSARREQHVQTLTDALLQDQQDNGGDYVASVNSLPKGTAYMIGTSKSGCDVGCAAKPTQSACVDLTELVTQGYLESVPFRPDGGSREMTGYYVLRDSSGVVQIGSCE